MRVLMFGWEFPPWISGGLGTACQGITKGLSGIGAEIIFVMPRLRDGIDGSHVKIVAASEIPQKDLRERDEYIRHPRFRAVESRLMPYGDGGGGKRRTLFSEEIRGVGTSSVLYGGPHSDYGADMFEEAERYGRAAGVIARQEVFDVIHGHDWMTVHAGIEARRFSGKPFIYHVHALEFDRSGENIDRRVSDVERLGLESADHVISVSRYTKKMIIEKYGIEPDKVTVVHNAAARLDGPRRHRVEKPKGRKTVLFLGRITYQKGPDYFIEAASKVLKRIPNAVFVMAGSGDMMPEMIEKVARLKLGRQFHFTGFIGANNVENIYEMSDVYVMPSVSEPFGISPLEAILHDVPVIISKQSGVSEIVKHALKVDFWDVNELSDKIIAILRYPALVKELTARASKDMDNIHWNAAAEKIMDVYGRVSGNGGKE